MPSPKPSPSPSPIIPRLPSAGAGGALVFPALVYYILATGKGIDMLLQRRSQRDQHQTEGAPEQDSQQNLNED
ncbi:hypothetical protein [Thermobaculum terrenum]|uniref:hypothetical protein n=1 Tax=Thermobaculum terrenum TaxID=166501 RepID=UPI00145E8E2C|nr:hypothetical protein [Thermobaculum terrenum]